MSFGERLKKLRVNMGLTQSELGDKLKLSKSNISKYESDDVEPNMETIKAISDYFKVSIDYLLDRANIKNLMGRTDTVAIPIVGVIRAGEPILAVENIEGYEYVDSKEAMNGEFFYLKVNGDSMINARICDGDLVYVRRQSDVDSGDIAVVLINGYEATLKRVLKTKNAVILQPENPKYKPMIFDRQKVESGCIEIIGKVLHVKFKV